MSGSGASRDEFGLIAEYLTGLDQGAGVALGNGDDAAVLELEAGEQLVVSTDVAAEGIHFPQDSPAGAMAYRAAAAAASDLAAMGARPIAMTLNLCLPDAGEFRLADLRAGLAMATEALRLPLVGGDLVRGSLSFGVQVLGAVPHGEALVRSGAAVGDRVCVSGYLGDASAGLAIEQGTLETGPEHAEALKKAFWRPAPAYALGQSLRGVATAAIDVSDGLLADAGHLARASGVRLLIEGEALPLSPALKNSVDDQEARRRALTGGEDYVLCFTLPPGATLPPGCTEIGCVEAGSGVGCAWEFEVDGYQHF